VLRPLEAFYAVSASGVVRLPEKRFLVRCLRFMLGTESGTYLVRVEICCLFGLCVIPGGLAVWFLLVIDRFMPFYCGLPRPAFFSFWD